MNSLRLVLYSRDLLLHERAFRFQLGVLARVLQ
jgi:hypothetical protein